MFDQICYLRLRLVLRCLLYCFPGLALGKAHSHQSGNSVIDLLHILQEMLGQMDDYGDGAVFDGSDVNRLRSLEKRDSDLDGSTSQNDD